jgi:hypothetical protein
MFNLSMSIKNVACPETQRPTKPEFPIAKYIIYAIRFYNFLLFLNFILGIQKTVPKYSYNFWKKMYFGGKYNVIEVLLSDTFKSI